MSKFLLEIAKIVGTSTKNSGSWVHTFFPTTGEKISRRGQLLAVISIANPPEEVEIATAGREIVSRLHEEYFGDLTASSLDQLKKTVEKISSETLGEAEVDVGVVAIVGKVLYAAANSQARLVLAREGKVATILFGAETISGYLQDEDLFCLGTGEFFRLVPQGVLQAALITGSPNEAAESLAPVVHGQEDGGKAAAVVFKVKEQKIQKPELPVVEEKVSKPKKIFQLGKIIIWRLKEKISEMIFLVQKYWLKKIISLKEKEKKTERPQKTIITVALVLLLILGVSVALGTRQKRYLGLTQKTSSLFQQAQEKFKEGESLLSLNPLKAKELLLEASNLTQQIELSGLKTEEFLKFKEELKETLTKALKQHQVEGRVFFDLELIKADAKGDDLLIWAGQIIVLDKNQSAVYGLGIKDKKSAILAGGEEFEDSSRIAASEEEVYVLTAKGILEIKLKNKQSLSLRDKNEKLKIVVEKDSDWGEVVDLGGFGGNLYLLDKKAEIWKYPPLEDGLGTKQRWLKEKADFSQAVSMAIDGVIWVLENDGEIWKFIRGSRESFRLTGLTKPLFDPSVIYTDSEQSSLYILDKGNSRIVVLAKSGEYDSEYVWEGIADISEMVVLEQERKIFLLGGSKIYTIEIKK